LNGANLDSVPIFSILTTLWDQPRWLEAYHLYDERGSELFEELRRDGTIPVLDDSYFRDLLLQFDATVNKSYCRQVGGRELAYYRIAGMSLFYLLSFLRSPTRALRVARALLGRSGFQPRTVFEQRLMEKASRWRTDRQVALTAP